MTNGGWVGQFADTTHQKGKASMNKRIVVWRNVGELALCINLLNYHMPDVDFANQKPPLKANEQVGIL